MKLLQTELWTSLVFGYALRALTRSRTFTATVVLTLAMGIAAATLVFSVVDGVLLRPLPYPDQDRLVEIVHTAQRFQGT
jgi:putative ABC transport system permease protein